MPINSQELIKTISNGITDPIELALEFPHCDCIPVGNALFNLLQNEWLSVDLKGNFQANT